MRRLQVEGVEKAYRIGGEDLQVLDGVDLDVAAGELVAIIGQSGSGKSTLLHQVGLLDEPDRGFVLLDGKDLPLAGAQAALARNGLFGFVFQFYHLLPEFSALDNVLMPALIRHGWGAWRGRKRAVTDRARGLLRDMGLEARMRHKPTQLSGGERQRVAIARALINEPVVLLCDEPTGNLDRGTAAGVRELLWELNGSRGQTIVLVTHDQGLARDAHRVLRLVDGALTVEAGSKPLGPLPLRVPAAAFATEYDAAVAALESGGADRARRGFLRAATRTTDRAWARLAVSAAGIAAGADPDAAAEPFRILNRAAHLARTETVEVAGRGDDWRIVRAANDDAEEAAPAVAPVRALAVALAGKTDAAAVV